LRDWRLKIVSSGASSRFARRLFGRRAFFIVARAVLGLAALLALIAPFAA
jgi:hypothetical protein